MKSIGTTETIYADRMYEVENGSARQLGTVNVYLGDTRLVSKVVPLNSPSTGYELQNVYYYHADHIGNSTLITDYQGHEFERDAFTPHGELWQQDTLDTLDKIDFLFTGKQMDAETGWYNFGKRYLNPKTGLWLSADPALGEYLPNAPLTDDDKKHNQSLPGNGGIYNPVNFALYHFAGNNPIRYTDPDGAFIPLIIWGLVITGEMITDALIGGAAVSIGVGAGVAIDNAVHAQAMSQNSAQAKPMATTQAQTKTKENGGNQVMIQIQGKAISANWKSSAGGGTVMGTIRSDKPITAAQVQSKIQELMKGLTFDQKGAVAKPVVEMSQFLERTAADGGVYGSGAYRTESSNKDNRVDIIWAGEMNLTLGDK